MAMAVRLAVDHGRGAVQQLVEALQLALADGPAGERVLDHRHPQPLLAEAAADVVGLDGVNAARIDDGHAVDVPSGGHSRSRSIRPLTFLLMTNPSCWLLVVSR